MSQLSGKRKKMRLISSYMNGYPVWCTWQVTYRCNFRCQFCCYWKEKPVNEATVAEFEAGSRELAKLGSLMINIAGGEPFLRQDMAEIVRALARYHFPFVTTNGWFITRERARQMWEAGLWGASVSIDYADAERHDRWRGIKGAWERAVRALKNFSEERTQSYQRVNVQCVLNHDNLEEIEPLIRLAAEHGAYFMCQPYAMIKTGNSEFVPQRKVSQHLLSLKARHRNFLSNPYFLMRFDEFFRGGIGGCLAGRAFFNIDNFLNVSICVETRFLPVGRLLEVPIEELMRRLRLEQERNSCRACWYNCRGEIESLYSVGGLLSSLPTLIATS